MVILGEKRLGVAGRLHNGRTTYPERAVTFKTAYIPKPTRNILLKSLKTRPISRRALLFPHSAISRLILRTMQEKPLKIRKLPLK